MCADKLYLLCVCKDNLCIVSSVLIREKIKQVGKSEQQSTLVVLVHCYHIQREPV